MGQTTKIEWCDHTFNPWRGCAHRILPDGTPHPGCDHCYAEAMSKRNPTLLGEWGEQGVRVCAAPAYWRQPFAWNAAAERAGIRARVFCASISDVFEDWGAKAIATHDGQRLYRCVWCKAYTSAKPKRPFPFLCKCGNVGCRPATMDDLRLDLFDIIYKTPNLDWLLLTKRPAFAKKWMRDELLRIEYADDQNPFANVWLGTSVSNQSTADTLVPELLKLRELAPVLFLSAEPLLGPLNLSDDEAVSYCNACGKVAAATNSGNCVLCGDPRTRERSYLDYLDWVIAGGESGHHARPMHPDWVRDIRDQCAAYHTPFFFKQWGEWAPADETPDPQPEPTTILKGTPAECVVMRQPSRSIRWVDAAGPVQLIDAAGKFTGESPRGLCMTRVGKHAAGRTLDGREHSEFPVPSFTPILSPAPEPAQ